MRLFVFQISGLTKGELKRLRDQSQLRSHPSLFKHFSLPLAGLSRIPRNVFWILAVLLGLYALQWTYVFSEKYGPSAIIFGQTVIGNNVVILEDTSGSMGAAEKLKLQALMNQLRAAGIKVDKTFETKGAGFGSAGEEVNSLKSLEKALLQNPRADTIFVFSDFMHQTPAWDDHDQVGFQRLRQLLKQRQRRLYLGTVNIPPDAELIAIANDSDGGLLQIKE